MASTKGVLIVAHGDITFYFDETDTTHIVVNAGETFKRLDDLTQKLDIGIRTIRLKNKDKRISESMRAK